MVDFGVFLPSSLTRNESIDGKGMCEFAVRAESLGFQTLWVSDNTFVRKSQAVLEPLTTLSLVVGQTAKIRLGTSVVVAPLRNPILLAKATSTLDHLSGGRLTLGLGIGWFENEFNAIGIPRNQRAKRTEEIITILRKLWRESNVSFKGRYYSFNDITIAPHPVQKNGPPIFLGGRSKAALERVAKMSDGWISASVTSTPELLAHGWEQIRQFAGQIGRGINQITPVDSVFCYAHRSPNVAYEAAKIFVTERYGNDFKGDIKTICVIGTPEDCIGNIRRRVEAGAQSISLWFMGDSMEQMEFFAGEIIPNFNR